MIFFNATTNDVNARRRTTIRNVSYKILSLRCTTYLLIILFRDIWSWPPCVSFASPWSIFVNLVNLRSTLTFDYFMSNSCEYQDGSHVFNTRFEDLLILYILKQKLRISNFATEMYSERILTICKLRQCKTKFKASRGKLVKQIWTIEPWLAILGFHTIPRDTKGDSHSGHVSVPNTRNNQNSFVKSTPTWPPWRQVKTGNFLNLGKLRVLCLKLYIITTSTIYTTRSVTEIYLDKHHNYLLFQGPKFVPAYNY